MFTHNIGFYDKNYPSIIIIYCSIIRIVTAIFSSVWMFYIFTVFIFHSTDSDNIHEDLAELTCEISIKQRLIEELETTQRRLHSMKVQYDEKITQLTTKIRETETERDKILSSLGKNMCGIFRNAYCLKLDIMGDLLAFSELIIVWTLK